MELEAEAAADFRRAHRRLAEEFEESIHITIEMRHPAKLKGTEKSEC